MIAFETLPGGEPGRTKSKVSGKLNRIIAKYPPYGKILADRQHFKNPPCLVIICVSGDCWQRSKNWQKHSNFASLVLGPEQFPNELQWPVKDCTCLIEWDVWPTEELIIQIVKCLFRSGATFVTVVPLFVDLDTPAEYFDRIDQKWHRARDSIRTYYPRNEVRHVAG